MRNLITPSTYTNWVKVVFDIECYHNYFLLVILDYATGQVLCKFEMINNIRTDSFDEKNIYDWLNSGYVVISFNGIKYDEMIMHQFSLGASNAKLKTVSDEIIQGVHGNKFDKLTPYKYERRYALKLPALHHIDCIQVAFGSASLKVYGARLKLKKLQELPLDPSATIEDHHLELMNGYCENDCFVTGKLFQYLKPAFNLRVSMGKYYGVGMDFLNKSDAQIGDMVVAIDYEKNTGNKLVKPNTSAYPKQFRYVAPDWIKFQLVGIAADTLDLAQEITYHINPKTLKVQVPEEFKQVITIGTKSYQLAVGGIHSKDDFGSYFEDDEFAIFNFDIGSFYPWIIQNGNFHPVHIPLHIWQPMYQNLIDRRFAAKDRVAEINDRLSDIDEELKSLGYNP